MEDVKIDIAERLAALEAEEAENAKADKLAEDLRRLARAELRKRCESELGGKEHEAFNIVETPRGFIVVKKCKAIVFDRLIKSDVSRPAVEEFVRPHLHEPKTWDEFVAIVDEWGGLFTQTSDACLELHRALKKERGKK